MHIVAGAVLLLVTIGWFGLAMLPALREHFGRSDIGPLRVTSEAADIRYFALSFQRFVDAQLPELRARAAGKHSATVSLSDGTPAWYAASGGETLDVFDDSIAPNPEKLVVVSETALHVPDDTSVLRELYTCADLDGSARNVFRAVLAGGNVFLGDDSIVLRWIDATGSLSVGRNATLWGRASSWGTMSMAEGARFQRLAAPRIEFGPTAEDDTPVPCEQCVVTPPPDAKLGSKRWVAEGDVDIPDGGIVDLDLVVAGTLTIGRRAVISGAVRSAVLVASDDCVFTRSIIATDRMTIGARCRVTGPVIVEGEATFGHGCRIGETGDETTITALAVRMGHGVVVCGEIWARRQGIVVAAPSSAAAVPAAS